MDRQLPTVEEGREERQGSLRLRHEEGEDLLGRREHVARHRAEFVTGAGVAP